MDLKTAFRDIQYRQKLAYTEELTEFLVENASVADIGLALYLKGESVCLKVGLANVLARKHYLGFYKYKKFLDLEVSRDIINILKVLAEDEEAGVRCAVAEGLEMVVGPESMDILSRLADDKNPAVSRNALESINSLLCPD